MYDLIQRAFYFSCSAYKMITLKEINVYPVKSLDGYSPSTALVEARGLQYDRRWMIVDQDGLFVSQRTCNRMTELRAMVENETLHICSKKDSALCISVGNDEFVGTKRVRVWDDHIFALVGHPEVSEFLSDFLGFSCQLVKIDETSPRQIDLAYSTPGEMVSFADAFPFLIIGEASLTDLNSRLQNKLSLPSRRFRANFIFSGGEAYVEDNWKLIKIANTFFSGRKNCGRCMMINLDPDTGKCAPEPLQVLSDYRRQGKSVLMGRHMCLQTPDPLYSGSRCVKVGDTIEILSCS